MSSALSAIERRTLAFYEWEVCGRGWHLSEYPIRLEPPLRPYLRRPGLGNSLPADDTRRPTWLSGLWDSLTSDVEDRPREEEAGPVSAMQPRTPSEPLVEFEIRLRAKHAAPRAASLSWLQGLSISLWPVSFELTSTDQGVSMIVAARLSDASIVQQSLRSYFPSVDLLRIDSGWARQWSSGGGVATIVEFGLGREFMLPLQEPERRPDPLAPFVGALGGVPESDTAVLQVLFEGAHARWAENVERAVTTPRGEPFFADAPELTEKARAKIAHRLYAVTVRLGVRSPSEERTWRIIRQVSAGLAQFGGPQNNTLIPLAGREDDSAEEDLLRRLSRRSGMIWNLRELDALVHVPEQIDDLPGLVRDPGSSRAAPSDLGSGDLFLGLNSHRGSESPVWLKERDRLRHMHVVGASGAGKSTLLLQLVRQDMANGGGFAVIDPHGDLAEDILGGVPEDRLRDVILIDPSREGEVVGWNVLSTDAPEERDILSSDLVAVFQRLSTSWGDQMTTVLSNAVDVFLERGGTLLQLRRFLIEERFRGEVIESIEDEFLRSYWTKEFPLIVGRRPQAPILTRLNAFLRSPMLRQAVTENEKPLDFRKILDGGHILIANLAQGTVGVENASLLGALLVSKLCQATIARQTTDAESRRPFYLYIDEFHQVATPSMASLFASMRKYRLGLVVVHQDLEQLRSTSLGLERSILANAHTRLAFRLGDRDARELARGFDGFEEGDLASLRTGEAICRVGGRDRSLNVRIPPLPPRDHANEEARREAVRETSLRLYGRRIRADAPPSAGEVASYASGTSAPALSPVSAPEIERPPAPPRGQGGPEHQYLQGLIREWAHQRGFHVAIEEPLSDGGRVDVALTKGARTIACEIAVTTPTAHEVANLEKCLRAGYDEVLLVSRRPSLLESVASEIEGRVSSGTLERVSFLSPEELWTRLDQEPDSPPESGTVAGYAVNVRVQGTRAEESKARSRAITEVITRSVQRLGKGEK